MVFNGISQSKVVISVTNKKYRSLFLVKRDHIFDYTTRFLHFPHGKLSKWNFIDPEAGSAWSGGQKNDIFWMTSLSLSQFFTTTWKSYCLDLYVVFTNINRFNLECISLWHFFNLPCCRDIPILDKGVVQVAVKALLNVANIFNWSNCTNRYLKLNQLKIKTKI